MPTQYEISKHLGLSLKGARNMLAKLEINNKTTSMDDIRHAYINNLNSVSLERSGHLDIANERLKLMDAQRRKTRLETKIIRMDYKEKMKPAIADKTGDKITVSEFMQQTDNNLGQLAAIVRNKPKREGCQNRECPNYPVDE